MTSRLAKSMASAARDLAADLVGRSKSKPLAAARKSLAAELGREVTPDEAAEVLAQSAICAAAILGGNGESAALHWLRETASEWEKWALEAAANGATPQGAHAPRSPAHAPRSPLDALRSPESADHLYDQFLYHYSPTSRKRHGVFFTPQPIADYIVRHVDCVLREDFGLTDGLAAKSEIRNPKSAIVLLDPACGTGIFLLAVIDHLHRRLGDGFRDFVPDLLPRLIGVELLPVPAFLARLNIALKLAATGYDFKHAASIQVHCRDALSPNPQSEIRNPQSTLPIILGNPPFSSLTTNTNPWMKERRGSTTTM
jgi:hypothetical protein